MIKFAKLGKVLLKDGALKRYSNIGFHNNSSPKSYQALKILDKQHHVFIINVFIY